MVDRQLAEDVIYKINKGINLGNGKKAKFLLLDYLLLTDVSLEEMYNYIFNNFSYKYYDMFLKFYILNKNKMKATTKNSLLEINYHFGDFSLSIDDKRRIIEFMKLNKLPMSKDLFIQIANRYFGSHIDLNIDYTSSLYKKINMDKSITTKQIDKVLDGIKNGVKRKDKIYPFELLDYYLITSMPLLGFRSNIKKYSDSDKRGFSKFYNDNRLKETSSNNNHIINLEIVIKDHRIDEAEKCRILEYMIDNNVPIFVSLFMQIARRYVNGEIKLNNDSKLLDTTNKKQMQRIFTRYKEYDTIIESKSWRY